jgi:hypothetical protein
VVLLGDSVFDNAAYLAGRADVVNQLERRLPAGWAASLLAVDGSVMAGVLRQLERLPLDATHLVVSMGGNDALGVSSILDAPSRSVADTLLKLADIRERFFTDYASTVDAILASKLPTAVCTIYDVRYDDPDQRRVAVTALTTLNDCITRTAAARGLPVLDLRLICNEDGDFANPIEPSEQGGGKIAAAIVALLTQHDFSRRRAELIVR